MYVRVYAYMCDKRVRLFCKIFKISVLASFVCVPLANETELYRAKLMDISFPITDRVRQCIVLSVLEGS